MLRIQDIVRIRDTVQRLHHTVQRISKIYRDLQFQQHSSIFKNMAHIVHKGLINLRSNVAAEKGPALHFLHSSIMSQLFILCLSPLNLGPASPQSLSLFLLQLDKRKKVQHQSQQQGQSAKEFSHQQNKIVKIFSNDCKMYSEWIIIFPMSHMYFYTRCWPCHSYSSISFPWIHCIIPNNHVYP